MICFTENGVGIVSNVIAALDWILLNKDQFNIRVANLSLGHPAVESAATDPLVRAAEAVWDADVVVVVSAGNAGREGYGTITSPGNSPKLITVGSVTHWGDDDPLNDIISSYSSRGPTLADHVVKPDLLAPGNRVISINAAASHIATYEPERLVSASGKRVKLTAEYLQLSGTSMAAAMVSGAAILMLEKDPSLNPASIKARLMHSADKVNSSDIFARGAGQLNISAARLRSCRPGAIAVGDSR